MTGASQVQQKEREREIPERKAETKSPFRLQFSVKIPLIHLTENLEFNGRD